MVVGVLGAASLLAVAPTVAAAAAPAAGCSVLTSSVYQASKPTGYTFISTSIPAYSASRDRYGFTIKQGISMRASTQQKAGTVPILRMYNANSRSFRWAAAGSPNARAASLAGFRTQGREFYAMPSGGAGCLRVYRYSRGQVDQLVVEGSNETSVRAAGWVRREALFSVSRGLSNVVPVTRGVLPAPKPPAPSPVKPGALKVIKGDLIASRPGQVIDRVDVRGSIFVRAANVTIKNSIVRGGTNAAARRYAPLVDNRAGNARLLVQDTVIAESTPSAWNASGIGGSNFTARRVKITGQVDSVNITGSNVLIENSVLGRNVY